jgi:hypothetical protein
MKIKTAWAAQSFFLCFLFNLAFAAVVIFMAGGILDSVNDWVSPLAGPGGSELPGEVQTALAALKSFLVQTRGYLMGVLGALATAFTLLMWLALFLVGRRQIGRAAQQSRLRPEPGTLPHVPTLQETSEESQERRKEGEEAL